MGILKKVFGGISVVGASGIAYLVADVHRNRVYPEQSLKDAARHYMTVRSLTIIGMMMKRKLEAATKDVEQTQADFLLQQIKENLNTEYSKEMGLEDINSVRDFITKHPLTRHSDYVRYINRMLSGEQKVLTSTEPSVFAVTSGTSGTSNIIPMVMKQTKIFFLEGVSVLYKCMVDAFPDTKLLNKDLKIFYNPNWRYTVNGIRVGPNSASPDRAENLLHIYTSPPGAYDVRSEPEALYLYLLFALLDPHVGMIEANFASIIYNALLTLESKYSQLAQDIELGRIDPNLNIDSDVRERLNACLSPNPERAKEIRLAVEEGTEGLALKLWPELHIILSADTGTFELYGDKLRNGYCKDIPLYSPIYAASEGLLGVNIWPTELPSRYLLHPRTQFFEFIPDYLMDEDQPRTLLLHQVRIDQMYELVITNPSCLYRYRFGDVVKVVGFHNQCPIVEFKYRKGQFLNVRGEKTSEAVFYEVLKGAITEIWDNVRLADYCCTESISMEGLPVSKSMKTSLPCYHVFLELDAHQEGQVVKRISDKQKKMLDDALMVHSYPYSSFRYKGSIAPLQVHLVRQGSFADLRTFMLEETAATSNQYKVPRVLRKPEAIQFMLDRIIG